MKSIWSLTLLFLGLCIWTLAGAQADVKMLVSTDMDCNWKLDGQPMGLLKVEDSKVVPVSPGEHLIRAATSDGVATMSTKVEVDQGQKTVNIQLKMQNERQSKTQRAETVKASADAARNPTWTDPDTKLTWTRKDNGSDVNWTQATAYCSNLQLAGYNGWRLPTIEELQGIDDPSSSVQVLFDNGVTYNVHIKGKIKLTGWQWSGSQVNAPENPWQVAWNFHFGNEKASDGFPLGFTYSMRALCVHPSKELRE